MKKRIIAIILSALLIFSFTVFASATETTYTEALLGEISKTGKFSATVTTFTSDEWKLTNNINFVFYDDIKNNDIRCNLTDKFVDILYTDSKLKLVAPKFFCYLPISVTDFPLVAGLTASVDAFQKLFKYFVDDPMLSAFTKSCSETTENGETMIVEHFKGKTIGVSGTFTYNSNGQLRKIKLSDNADVSIAFTLSDFSTSFDSNVFDIPLYYINLAVLSKIIIAIVTIMNIL